MGYGLIDTNILTNIADAIREKLGVQTQYKPSQMPEAIESISGGGITPTGTKSITANGTYDVTAFASAEVNVPQSGITPTGTKSITANGTYDVTAFASAEVNVPQSGITPTGTKSITANGTYDVTAFASAEVNVPQSGITPTGTKQVSITANGTTTEDVTNYADAQITVNVVNQDYEDALVALGVTEDLTDSIEALTTYANGVTGESDTNLSDAVHTLGSGYGGGGAGGLKYTRYDITSGDITIKTLLDTIDYAPVDPSNFTLFIRSSGAVAPTSGSYTHNNFFVRTTDVGALRGGYSYRSGKVTPNSFNDLYFGFTEVNNNFAITDGILRYTGSTTSCLGTTGDTIVIAELYGTSHISIEKMAGTGLTSIDNI